MYAIIVDGGRQYKVTEGQELVIDYRDASSGDALQFDEVVLLSDSSDVEDEATSYFCIDDDPKYRLKPNRLESAPSTRHDHNHDIPGHQGERRCHSRLQPWARPPDHQ